MKKLLLALVLLGLLAAVVVGTWAWAILQRPVAPPGGERRVTLPTGTGAQAALDRLEAAGVIADARLARLAWQLGDSPPFQAGIYLFDRPLTATEVIDKLARGDVVQVGVTVVEGLSLDETVAVLVAAGLGSAERFAALVRDPGPIADLDPDAEDLEGYLFPDSYRFHEGVSEEQVVAALVGTFRRRWEVEIAPRADLEQVPGEGGSPLRRLVTLASIVEKEARLAEERPQIAAVYTNRLRRGIALYADPTVIYALRREGKWDGNIRKSDLAVDSPYNTYRYPGLPPGPICSPGLASLRAAAEPADVPWIYFVSRNDGSHVFASTLAEHNRNVERWQRRYWREERARQRAEAAGKAAAAPGD